MVTTPASTTLSTNKTIDPKRHQGYVQEWIVGYRTQLPGAVTFDASYIDRAYKDRPAQVDTYTLAYDHIDGTWQPNDPAAILQPQAFANNARTGTVRG